MRFCKLFAAIALSVALMLTGCSDGEANSSEPARVRYAKVYNPDGTLLVEGECTKAQSGRAYGYASIEIDGVTYDTGLDNVIVISWYE
mgnify:CR=1 FL=1